jgi:uncharacterized protein (DUF362 family)
MPRLTPTVAAVTLPTMPDHHGTAVTTTRATVGVVRVANDVGAAVREALELADWEAAIAPGDDVALKVNLGWERFIPGSVTSPAVVEELIRVLKPRAGRIFVVEADQVLEDVESAFHRSGMDAVCARTGARWVNFSRHEMVTVSRPDNIVLKRTDLPKILQETRLVTVPVLKTHGKTVISGALKNQWGCLSKARHEYHLVLAEAIADINALVRPVLALTDGTIGLEGNGPKSGWPRVADRMLSSRDLVAIDTVHAMLIGVDPSAVAHLATAARRGLGTNDPRQIDVRGTPVEDARVPFRLPRENLVGSVETLLRGSLLKRLFFDTPLFSTCLWAARRYYDLWLRRHGARCWDIACAHPVYGPQWRAVRAGHGAPPA